MPLAYQIGVFVARGSQLHQFFLKDVPIKVVDALEGQQVGPDLTYDLQVGELAAVVARHREDDTGYAPRVCVNHRSLGRIELTAGTRSFGAPYASIRIEQPGHVLTPLYVEATDLSGEAVLPDVFMGGRWHPERFDPRFNDKVFMGANRLLGQLAALGGVILSDAPIA